MGGRRRRSSAGRRPGAARASTASAGRPSLCTGRDDAGPVDESWQGAFARYKSCTASQLLRVPDGLSLRGAALAEPLAVALHGITPGPSARPGDRVLVTGAGPIGTLVRGALRARGSTTSP